MYELEWNGSNFRMNSYVSYSELESSSEWES